jgi:hypothetical protein
MTKEPDDEIVAEIRRRREAHAQSFGFDLTLIVEELMRQERESGVDVVERQPRKPQTLANERSA